DRAAATTVFTVTNTSASGPGSLRQAILDANANPGADTILFAIGSGAKTIAVAGAPLPVVTDPVTIDGTSQPRYAGVPLIRLAGHTGIYGLVISGGSSVVRGLVIGGFSGGIMLQDNDGDTVAGNLIGLLRDGTPVPND